MSSYFPKEVKFKVTLLILFVLISNILVLTQECKFNRWSMGRDAVTLYERRFEGLKKMLPDQGVVGYITDQSPKKIFADAHAVQRYYLTQYALSPVIVDNDLEYDFVVGNFHHRTHNHKKFKDRDLIVLKDFGNGVILFKRRVK